MIGRVSRITVVIPTYRNYDLLQKVLAGYERQTVPSHDFEVIVVADAAEPNLARVQQAAGQRPFSTRVLRGIVPGASGNRNVGWRAAEGPLTLFTDDDTIPVRRFLAQHLRSHAGHPESNVAVVGLVRWAPGIRVTPFMRWLELGVQFDYGGIRGSEASWAHTYSSNLSVKRSFLERVGGYDEERLPYGYEDLDWGYRARDHGLRVIYNRRAIVDHWRSMTVEQWQARAPRLASSEWQFCQMHPDFKPWFWQMFSDAAKHPPSGRNARQLAALIPRWVPWLGRRVWERASLQWRQEIAPYFLDAWDLAANGTAPEPQPAASALAERSSPGGS
jgi:GT2 family glycosyltransferase